MRDCAPRSCATPGTLFRRLNSLWSCPDCGQVFVLRVICAWDDSTRAWQRTTLRVTA